MMIPERYPDQIAGVLSCYDRMILQGTLPGWCYDQGMTAFLYARQIKIPDSAPAMSIYSLSCFMVSRMNAGRSEGSREVTRLPSTTTSLSS
jgi:hypothetical protein